MLKGQRKPTVVKKSDKNQYGSQKTIYLILFISINRCIIDMYLIYLYIFTYVFKSISVLTYVCVCVCVCVCVAQSCLILCNLMDYSPPSSSIHEFSRQEYWSGLPFPSPYIHMHIYKYFFFLIIIYIYIYSYLFIYFCVDI